MSHPPRPVLLLVLALLLPAGLVHADQVMPSDRVQTGVVVRAAPEAGSSRLGKLRPGEVADWIESVKGWHRVRLADQRVGFVSAAWTRVLPGSERALDPGRLPFGHKNVFESVGSFFKNAWASAFRGLPAVEFLIEDPKPDMTVHQDTDPRLPVAGFATPAGSRGQYDIVLVIDTSTSTNESADADVNGDSVTDEGWRGSDSILRAEVTAALAFLHTLRRLPRNAEGERIRVGVVSFAGDDSYHRAAADRDMPLTPESIFMLAQRDARLVAPLSSDYDAVETGLERLAEIEPSGMSNFAAGIGRAVIELVDGEAAAADPRPRAEKVVHFLTDGKPRLPYDRERAERAALYAAKLAAYSNVRVNAFALGENIVTRKPNASLRRAAHKTHGTLVELSNPGDVTSILNSTSFAFVDRVKLVNITTDQETDYISTGIDGSFYGEIPLEEGLNQIQLIAVLQDESEQQDLLQIEYRYGRPFAEIRRDIERVQEENAVLIEQIRANLAREMKAARAEQRRQIELHAENPEGKSAPPAAPAP